MEEVPNSITGWGAILAPLGVAGILAWYLYYTTSVTFPRLSKENRESNASQQKEHRESNERLCKEFTEALREERDFHREQAALNREAFRCDAMHQPKGS